MQFPVMNAAKVLAAATTMSALAFIPVPGPAQADSTCTLDSPVLTIDVTDGSVFTVDWSGTHPTGSAKSVYEGGKVKFGNATGPGVVPPSNIDFTINWGDVSTHMTGAIDPAAGFAYGQAAKGGNTGGWTWSAQHEHFTCAATQSPAAQNTATVNKPDDIYNLPDGHGTAYTDANGKNIFAPPGQVQLATNPQRCDDWCHIVTNKVTGDAWIYGAEGYVTVP
jgi:hypothetical protein